MVLHQNQTMAFSVVEIDIQFNVDVVLSLDIIRESTVDRMTVYV